MLTLIHPARRPPALAGSLVCTRCGIRLPLDASVLDLARDELAATTGFALESGSLELSGCCALCRAGRDATWGRA